MESLLLLADRYVAEPLGGLVLAVSARKITGDTDSSTSTKASWFLSPKQHALEFIALNVLFVTTTLYFYRIAIQEK